MLIAQARVPGSFLNILSLTLVGCLIVPVLGCRSQEAGGTATAEAPATAMNAWEGVNYDPATPDELVSVPPLKFEGAAEIDGEPADLQVDYTSWIVGVTVVGPGKQANGPDCKVTGEGADRTAECGVTLVRFGQFGHLDQPKKLWWGMNLELKPDTPNGTLRAAVDKDGMLVYPASIRFDLPLILFSQEDGAAEAVRLRSRTAAVFEGTVDGWPLGLSVVSLVNGPLSFFREGTPEDDDAKPEIVLKSGTFAFADKPSEFFRRKPEVTAQVVGPSGGLWKEGEVGGVSVSWTGTAENIRTSQVSGYSVYRKQGEPGTWQRIASVARDTTSYLDKTNDGKSESEYVVVHAMEYPFNGKYEGLYGSPAIVQPVVR